MKNLFTKFVLSFFSIILINESAYSLNEQFRSITSGNWNVNSTWEMSTNSGSTWIAATLTPTDASNTITVRSPDSVSVTTNVNADQLTVNSGAILYISVGITLTLKDGTSTDFTILTGGFTEGPGTFQTQGLAVTMNIRGGSFFNTALKVNTGVTTCSDQSSPFVGKLYNNVTVDAGANLSTGTSSSYDLEVFGSILNNGIISSSSAELVLKGSALVNNSSITSNFRLDSVSNLSGAGTITSSNIILGANSDITLLNNITVSPSTFNVNNGGSLDLNTYTFTITSGTFTASVGSTVVNSGIFRTQNTVSLNIRGGSDFRAPIKVNTGTTTVTDQSSPFIARIYGSLTVDNGAALSCGNSSSYDLEVFGAVVNNGIINGIGSEFVLKGPSLINSNTISSVLRLDTISNVSGAGSFTGNSMSIGSTGNITCLSNLVLSPINTFTLNTGGVLNPNTFAITFTDGTNAFLTGSTVSASGLIQTQNSVTLNLRTGSAFNAPLKVLSGNTIATELSSPFNGKLFGSLTVDAGATFNTGSSSSYSLEVFGNILNNGTISGSGSELINSGSSLINNSSITSSGLRFKSTSALSGAGTFTSNIVIIDSNDVVNLLSNVAMNTGLLFSMKFGSVLNPNGFIFTQTNGEFEVSAGATVSNSGTFRTQGTVNLNLRNGSSFSAPLNVNTGINTAHDNSSPFRGRLYGPVTIDNGAELKVGTSSSYSLEFYGNVTNNGSITGPSGSEFIFPNGVHTFQGSGFCTAPMVILSGGILNVTSNHNFYSVNINLGGTMNIANQVIGFSAPTAIIQNGTFTTTNTDIIYNGIVPQSISTTNITYAGLKINNAAGTTLTASITIPDTLAVILGDLDLNGFIITVTTAGYLTETAGNTVKGNAGYLTTTRNVGTPSALNVGGFGAVLTATSNLGSTEIKRGHTVQTGLNGGTSIRRYYDITPANNSGLTASLKYKFDDSELNGKPKPLLKLFKSTNTGTTWLYQGGSMNIATNEITMNGITSFSRWSADSSKASAAMTLIMEGFYNVGTNNLNMKDTVRAYLRNVTTPYAIVDSAIGQVDSLTFKSGFQFPSAASGTYYIQLKHRNSLETWSKNGVIYYQDSTLNYDFTFAASQSFGNNTILKGTKYCLYSGDVTQDGFVDLTDVVQVYNNSTAFINGYVVTDVNGDRITDLSDVIITYNNSNNFVQRKTPLNP